MALPPAGPRGFPGPRGSGQKGDKGDVGDSGITLTDNLDGSYTISTVNPPQSIVFFAGQAGATPIKGVDYFDGASGNYISYIFAQVPTGESPPTVDAGTGSFNGTTEVYPTGSTDTLPAGSAIWQDDPVYTSGYDTYASKGVYRHDPTTGGNGTWTLVGSWSTPILFREDVSTPQTRVTSYVFRRSNVSLAGSPPTGGTYADPTPIQSEWSDGIPVGTAPVYFSKRVFTNDGNPPQEAVWSDPVLLLNNGQGTKFQFGPTNTGPWEDTPAPDDEWMITCAQQIDGSWVCDTANPVRIKGETGLPPQAVVTAYAFKRSEGPLVERPLGGDYLNPFPVDGVVSGWTRNIPEGSADIYISTRIFTSDQQAPQEAEWSVSSLFSGAGAIQLRVEQSAYLFKFDKDGLNPYPNQIDFTAFRQNIGQLVTWEVYEDDDSTIISTAANKIDTDNFSVTASEFGLNNQIRVVATAGIYTDTVYIQRVQDGLQGPAGVATEIREVRFQFAPDNNGGAEPVTGWHNAPVLNTDRWLREATFYDGVIQGSWSAGVKFVGDDGALTYVQFWFSATGTGNPDTDPAEWSQTQSASDFYVISQEIINSVPQGWGAVVYIRGDDGVDGKYFETQFALANADSPPQIDLTSPVAPDYDNTVRNPPGWTTDVGSLTPTGLQVIWAITATINFDDTLDTNWTAAQQWGAYTPQKGNDYTDGLAGVFRSNYFIASAAQPSAPSGGSYTAAGGETGVNLVVDDPDLSGAETLTWVDDPFSPPAGHYIWVTYQNYVPAINPVTGINEWTPSGWSTPARFAYIPTFGVDYNDGDTGLSGKGTFTSYVFRNAATQPATPTNGSYTTVGGEVLPTLPDIWTDDPVEPADNTEFIWVSKRVYEKPEGQIGWVVETNWTTPVQFSGTPPFTGSLTNAAAVVNTLANGTGYNLTGTNGVFECVFGSTDVTNQCNFTISGFDSENATYYYKTLNGLDLRINKTTGAYDYSLTGNDWTSDQETFVLVATYSGTSTVVSQKLTIAKARGGATGATGAAGADGIDGTDGNTVANITIYRRDTSTPATPSGGAYNFDTNVVTAPDGWSSLIPAGSDPIYASVGIAAIVGTSGVDSSIPWGSPNVLAQNGTNGTSGSDGRSVFQATIYRRSATPPATPADNSGSYNFTTNVLTPPTGWSAAPPAGAEQLYSSQATFEIVGPTGTDNTQTWTTPIESGVDGIDGAAGLSTYQMSIFIRAASQPATPSGGSFNFGNRLIGTIHPHHDVL